MSTNDITLMRMAPTVRFERTRRIAASLSRDWAAVFALIVLAIVVTMALIPGILAPYEPDQQVLRLRRTPPSMEHPFGMDELGRDLLSRIIYGARYTLGTATVAVLLSLLVGVPIGLFAGYRGGLTDMLLMRTIDALLSFPYFLVGIMLAAVLGGSLVTAVLAMGLTLIPNFARVTRGCVLGMRHNDYVLSAEAIGCKVPRILWRYVLPNVLAPLAVVATLNMATAILGVSALGFLGLGLQPPTSEWGLMLSNAKNALQVAPHTMVFPGLAIVLTVTATNLFGDYLRELIDPTMKT